MLAMTMMATTPGGKLKLLESELLSAVSPIVSESRSEKIGFWVVGEGDDDAADSAKDGNGDVFSSSVIGGVVASSVGGTMFSTPVSVELDGAFVDCLALLGGCAIGLKEGIG